MKSGQRLPNRESFPPVSPESIMVSKPTKCLRISSCEIFSGFDSRVSMLTVILPEGSASNGRAVKVGSRAVAREVSLLWDAGTLADLRSWKDFRQSQGATGSDYFLCSQQTTAFGRKLDRRNARIRFIGACKALGDSRANELTVHSGRHSFVSLALAGGRSLAEVRDAAGHSNISVTSAYIHCCQDDDDEVGNLFDFTNNNGNGDSRP